MITLRHSRSLTTLLGCAAVAFATMTAPASATTEAIDPMLAKQEEEVERLLRNAEAEFWTLKQKMERDRTARAQRVAAAKSAYEKAQRAAESAERSSDARESAVAAHRADEALERYQAELERAMSGVDSARDALGAIESRVGTYRATLEALRRRTRNPSQNPNSIPASPDSSGRRVPITDVVGTKIGRCG